MWERFWICSHKLQSGVRSHISSIWYVHYFYEWLCALPLPLPWWLLVTLLGADTSEYLFRCLMSSKFKHAVIALLFDPLWLGVFTFRVLSWETSRWTHFLHQNPMVSNTDLRCDWSFTDPSIAACLCMDSLSITDEFFFVYEKARGIFYGKNGELQGL